MLYSTVRPKLLNVETILLISEIRDISLSLKWNIRWLISNSIFSISNHYLFEIHILLSIIHNDVFAGPLHNNLTASAYVTLLHLQVFPHDLSLQQLKQIYRIIICLQNICYFELQLVSRGIDTQVLIHAPVDGLGYQVILIKPKILKHEVKARGHLGLSQVFH